MSGFNGPFNDSELFDEKLFESELEKDTNTLTLFKDTLKNSTDVLKQRFKAGRAATELVQARSNIVDAVLVKAWLQYFPAKATDIALLAVGGYGRGELHPASDVDVQILLKMMKSITTKLWGNSSPSYGILDLKLDTVYER